MQMEYLHSIQGKVHPFPKANLPYTFILLLSLLTTSLFANQPGKTISGTITDSSTGEPLMGVNIVEQNTTNGVVSDFDGNYSITLSSENAVLVFSFIGYLEESISVEDRQTLNVSLMPDIQSLNEVIVIGYGTQNSKDKTGALVQINSDELQQGVLQDPIQSLTGRVAGVSIMKPGSDPNAGFSVIIRGMSGFQAGTSPLYVVDGVPGVDPTTISPDNIASFTVLKDASAAAIYGSRAANGVVIINTRTGSYSKQAEIEVNTSYSYETRAKELDVFSADDLRAFVEVNNLATGFDDRGESTDWQDVIFRDGAVQNHSIAVSGGSENTKYRGSISFQDFQGVIRGSDKQRTIVRVNTSTRALNEKLTISLNTSGTFEENSYVNYGGTGAESILFQTYTRNPTYPVYDSESQYGGFFEVEDFENSNPLALIEGITDNREAKRYLFNVRADLELLKGLTYTLNSSYVFDDEQKWYFKPSYLKTETEGGRGSRNYGAFNRLLFEHTVNYKRSFLQHNVDILAGYTWQEENFSSLNAFGKEFISNSVGADNLGYANVVQPRDIGSYSDNSRLISFIGRAIYNYNSKYFVTATLRRDGSSRFGDNHKWGLFPSASVAWDIAQENLPLPSQISQLKLRVGYGKTGNQEIGNYNSILRYDVTGRTLDLTRISEEENQALQMSAVNNPNPDLKWEENVEYNLGLDVGVYNDRFIANVEYYYKETSDILAWYSVPVPPNKHNFTFANVGELTNQGIEISLSGALIERNDFSWNTIFTFSKNKQIVKSLSNDLYQMDNVKAGYISGRGLVSVWTQIVEPGTPFGTFNGWQFAGVNDKGEALYFTAEGSVTTNQDDADRVNIGSAQPDFISGWSNNLKYKNFDASISLRAVVGHDILNVTKMLLGNSTTLPNRNVLVEEAEANTAIGFTDAPEYSDKYLEKASFLRCDHASIGYSFNTSEAAWISKARISLNANNLFTITPYSGLDPESNYQGYSGVGIDQFDVYPKTRSITIGANLTF
jgi:TonB-linked SusC/RagA family outer membrane protein